MQENDVLIRFMGSSRPNTVSKQRDGFEAQGIYGGQEAMPRMIS